MVVFLFFAEGLPRARPQTEPNQGVVLLAAVGRDRSSEARSANVDAVPQVTSCLAAAGGRLNASKEGVRP